MKTGVSSYARARGAAGWRLWALPRRALLVAVLCLALVPVVGGPSSASAPSPTVHYTFDGNLTDSAGGSTLTAAGACPGDPCNSATSFGSDANGGYWAWTSTNGASGGGFTVQTNAAVATTYTTALKFSFAEVSGWRKIVDYQNRASDDGFYFRSGKLRFYPYSNENATAYPADTVLDLVAVRQATGALTGTFTVYAVGADSTLTLLFTATDTSGASIPYTSGGVTKFGFFFDDTETSDEATLSGRVYDLRIWSGVALSQDDLREELGLPAPSSPAPAPAPVTVIAPTFTG